MPETGRVLRFPSARRSQEVLSNSEALALAERVFEASAAERSEESWGDLLLRPEAAFAFAGLLYERRDVSPSLVLELAEEFFTRIRSYGHPLGLFDERDYLLGELALTAGAAARQAGRRSEADRWLNRAEANFRHVLNPGPKLSEVGYLRLALKFDRGEYDEVIELLPSLVESYKKLAMPKEVGKAEFLNAMCLKGAGKYQHASDAFTSLAGRLDGANEPVLLAQTKIELGSFSASDGRFTEALAFYGEALNLLKNANRPIFNAHLKATVAETMLLAGQLDSGVAAFREAIGDYVALGMATQVAYLRLVLAEALIANARPREGEWEILAAIPTIDEQQMVREGFAALALLKESVRQRKTDPNALRELREHLQAANQK